jgi:hypothetical protein
MTHITPKLIFRQRQYPTPSQTQQALLQVELKVLYELFPLRNFTVPNKIMLNQGNDNTLSGPGLEFGVVADLC